jgi:hypothetical protein
MEPALMRNAICCTPTTVLAALAALDRNPFNILKMLWTNGAGTSYNTDKSKNTGSYGASRLTI